MINFHSYCNQVQSQSLLLFFLFSVFGLQAVPIQLLEYQTIVRRTEVKVRYSREIDPCPPCRGSHCPWTVGVPPHVGWTCCYGVRTIGLTGGTPTVHGQWEPLHGGQGSISPQV